MLEKGPFHHSRKRSTELGSPGVLGLEMHFKKRRKITYEKPLSRAQVYLESNFSTQVEEGPLIDTKLPNKTPLTRDSSVGEFDLGTAQRRHNREERFGRIIVLVWF